jgi:hypothetical protein
MGREGCVSFCSTQVFIQLRSANAYWALTRLDRGRFGRGVGGKMYLCVCRGWMLLASLVLNKGTGCPPVCTIKTR